MMPRPRLSSRAGGGRAADQGHGDFAGPGGSLWHDARMKRGGALEGYVVSAAASAAGALVGAVAAFVLHSVHLGVPAVAVLLMTPLLVAALNWRSLERRRLRRAFETGFVAYFYTYPLAFWLGDHLVWWTVAVTPFAGAVVGAFARLCGTIARPGAEPRPFVPRSRRAVVLAGTALLIVSVAFSTLTIWAALSVRRMTKDMFAPVVLRADLIVCEDTMTAACAQAAADRAGDTVAWLPGANGFKLGYVVASSHGGAQQGFAFEHFSTGDGGVFLELSSGEGPFLEDVAGITHIVIDGRPVLMQITKGPGGSTMLISFDWEVDGRPYTLSVGAQGLFSDVTLDEAQMTTLYRQIRYVYPSAPTLASSSPSGGGP